MPENTQFYPKAPIVEAAIELRFGHPLEVRDVEKIYSRMKRRYATAEPVVSRDIHVDVLRKKSSFSETSSGYKLASHDQTDVAIVNTAQFISSRLAPYMGWESYVARAQSDWADCRRVVGYHKVERVGVRFINRIDIARSVDPAPNVADYLVIYPHVPDDLKSQIRDHLVRLSFQLPADGCVAWVSAGTAVSPLIAHHSFLLDIDVSIEKNIPTSDDELWALVNRMRVYKNTIFEALVTDRSREAFRS